MDRLNFLDVKKSSQNEGKGQGVQAGTGGEGPMAEGERITRRQRWEDLF
jgi:hypothetical protein